jgi:hypothetical protein
LTREAGGETVFDFLLGPGRERPHKFLAAWQGMLETKGYQAYDGVGGPKLAHVGRRADAGVKFIDAVKINRDPVAPAQMVMRMDALFLADRHAREKQITLEGAPGGALAQTPRLGARDPWGMREARDDRVAGERTHTGGRLDSQYVAEAASLFRLCGSGTVEQSGGQLDAAGSVGAHELAACGRGQSGREGGGAAIAHASLEAGVGGQTRNSRFARPTPFVQTSESSLRVSTRGGDTKPT